MDADLGELGRRRRRANGEAFSPYTLFASGEQGVWYDPSDLTPEKVSWRRNLLTYSQDFENAAWTKSNASILSNLALYSQDFNNAWWSTARATISANTSVAPDGTTTAETLTEDTATGSHVVFAATGPTVSSGISYTLSVYAKANTRSFVYIEENGSKRTWFNLSSGTVGTTAAGTTASIVNVGSGWYRCIITFTSSATTQNIGFGLATADNTFSYTGDGTSSLFLWGAQLVPGSTAQTYTRSLATAAPIQFADPLGGTLADKLVENTATAVHSVQIGAGSDNRQATFSIYAKAAERPRLSISNGPNGNVDFNLLNGTVAAIGSGWTTAGIADAGNGWYRCWVVSPLQVWTNANILLNNGTTYSYAGDGVSGIYIYGAQFELNVSNPSAYQRITNFNGDFSATFPNHVLYQESVGPTPVTALGQSVGLVLDKRLGPPGAERITNGSFASGTGWAFGVGWSLGNNNAVCIASSDNLNFAFTAVTGRTYRVQFDFVHNAGSLFARIGQGTGVSVATSGTHVLYLVCGASTTAGVDFYGGTVTGFLTNISVREVPGNHAIQATSAARPTLQARSNLLTYTEQMDNAIWTKLNASVTANGAVSPDGSTTADKIVENTATNFHAIRQQATTVAGVIYNFSVYVKAAERNFAQVRYENGGSTQLWAVSVNLTTGAFSTVTFGSPTSTSASVTDAGNGWWRVSIGVASNNTTFSAIVYSQDVQGSNTSYTGDGTSGVFVWGAQVEQASTASTYQRVVTATDYADVGLPRNLTFDGVDDSLATAGNVDFATWTVGTRRNLLVNPTQFDASSWAVTQVSVTPNTAIAPDGTTTADKMVELAVASSHSVLQSVTTTAGVVYTYSVYVKKAERNFAQVRYENGGSTQLWAANVNLTDGTYTTATFGSPTSTSVAVTDAGNGWWRVALGVSSSNTTFQCIVFSQAVQGTNSYTGDGTSGLYLWGAQLEVGSTATAFQDVGTDKVTLFSGVTKLSDAAIGIATELGTGAQNGSILLGAPASAGTANYNFRSQGTIGTAAQSASSFASPITNVLCGIADIAGDSVILRINGTQAASNTGDQGTGTYGSYLLYVGRRASTSLPFNGRLFQLVIRGAATDSVTVGNAERWVGQLTGVTL